ncbi:MAG: hypothetical protein R3C11_20125 [Planctomycetaceae bacterium]
MNSISGNTSIAESSELDRYAISLSGSIVLAFCLGQIPMVIFLESTQFRSTNPGLTHSYMYQLLSWHGSFSFREVITYYCDYPVLLLILFAFARGYQWVDEIEKICHGLDGESETLKTRSLFKLAKIPLLNMVSTLLYFPALYRNSMELPAGPGVIRVPWSVYARSLLCMSWLIMFLLPRLQFGKLTYWMLSEISGDIYFSLVVSRILFFISISSLISLIWEITRLSRNLTHPE